MEHGTLDALGLHCNPCYILCLRFADLTDCSVSKKLLLDFFLCSLNHKVLASHAEEFSFL